MNTSALDLLVDRRDLHTTRIARAPAPAEPADGEAVLRVDRFALTTNNVTYAAFGDSMSYWDFFPSGDAAWGRVPAWGFGTVVAARVDGVAVGDRFYGYYPMSSTLVVRPTRVKPTGFVDGSAHREALHPLYNQYVANAADPLYDPGQEALQLLLRPLFITSFVIDDFLADNDFFGARAVVLSSASSKTAYGLAWQLSLRRPDGPEVIGLTSTGNVAFVESLGCYDRVVTYDAFDSIASDLPVVFVDFAGDRDLRARLHRHFEGAMRYSCAVGSSHTEAERTPDDAPLPGAKPTFFFAPVQIRKRVGDWGADGFQQRFAGAWHGFIARVSDAARPWMRVREDVGLEAAEQIYQSLLSGRAPPDEGRIVRLD